MPNTNAGYPYVDGSEFVANWPAALLALAQAVGDMPIPRFTDATARNSAFAVPVEGMVAYLQDTDQHTWYLNGGWRQGPWGVPWGEVANAEATATQTGISAIADLTNLAATWTAVAGRKYLITGHVLGLQNTSAGIPEVRVTTSGNTQVGSTAGATVAAGSYVTLTPRARITGLSAGSVTYKLRGTTTAGTLTSQASATAVASILVQDIGPA